MRTIQNIEKPIWQDINTKDRILARFVYDDGGSNVVSFPVDESNEDYKMFLTFSSIEDADANTDEIRAEQAAAREKAVAQSSEKAEQKRANTLFNAKIEAFENPVVQTAPKEWKSMIRKATTSVEVIAIVAALIIKYSDPVVASSTVDGTEAQ